MKKSLLKRKTPLRARSPSMSKKKPLKRKNGTKKRVLKPNRIKTLKKKLWSTFSQYIRLTFANNEGMLMTCDGKYTHWLSCHCGHLLHNSERSQSLGGNELWYYENNFAPQSVEGNYFNKNDSAGDYMLWAIKRYGMEEVEKMKKMKQTYKKWTEEELNKKLRYYSKEVSKLIEELDLI